MAVYRRGYQRYEGARTSNWDRIMVLPRYSWGELMSQRLVIGVLIGATFWPLLCCLFIYLSNHTELLAGFGQGFQKFLAVDGSFFRKFMQVQSTFAIGLAAMCGPGLIAPDLANNALPLYFSRPMSRWEYVLARLIVLAGMLSAITWIPGLFIYGMQVSMAGGDWFAKYWHLGAALVVGFWMLVLLTSLVALASSAWVKWRVVAGALVLAFFFVLAGAATMVNAVFQDSAGSLINPMYLLGRLWAAMMGIDAPDESEPAIFSCISALLGLCGLMLMVLERKLRPVEVVK
ncbi:MAG: ABC transporter permease [Bryobacteraceae bacterium]|nr:ABC transporter permease [Bryobacteraceae bacterium]